MAIERDEYEFIARFRADALLAARQAEEALRGMGDAADDTANQMKGANSAIEQAQEAAEGLAKFVASAVATFAIINGALREFAAFEVQMLAIAKVSDLTAAELDAMGESFERLAYKAGLPVEDFLKVGEVAGQLGISGAQNIENFAAAMVDLGGASNITAEEGANAIARMLNVTKESITIARTVASILVELGNTSAATEKEIVDRAQEIALATAAFGTSSVEALALGAAMAELGLRAETSGTAIGRVFIAMSEAVVSGGSALDEFAKATELTTAEFRNMQAADPTALFYRLLESMSDKSQNEIISTLTKLNILNAENAKTLIPLITGYERVKEVRESAYAEQANPAALDQEAARAAEALARQWAGLMQGLQAEVRQLGELIAPVAQFIIDLAKAALDAFNGLPEIVQNTIMLATLLAPAFVAAGLAAKGLALALGLIIPAGLRLAVTGGAVGATMAGMGTAGVAATGALAGLRYALGALLGPIGLVLAVAGTLAYALSDSGEAVDSLDMQLSTAEQAMQAFTEATDRAKQEQIGLRDGVSEATDAILAQSRAAAQAAKDALEESLRGFMDSNIAGNFASQVEGELSAVGEALEELARTNPNNAVVPVIAGIIGDLKEGRITIDEARDSLNKFLGLGSEAIEIVSRYRNAAENLAGDPEAFRSAARELVEYARATGLFGEELEFVQRMLNAGDTEAAMLAMADLAGQIEYAGEAGNSIRDILSPALIEAIGNAADAEVRVAALNALLAGNRALAEEILRTGNPFANIEDGANDAAEAVRTMGTAMADAYSLYDRMREFDPSSTDRGSWSRGAATAAERGMLDLIGYAEGTDRGDGYNETLGYGAYTGGDVNLINMTLREVLALQRQMLAHPNNTFNSSAVGRYQIVGTTLGGEGLTGNGGLIARLGLSLDDLFTPALQDRMAMELLRGRRGQGVDGLRNEWEGLRNVAPETINAAMSGQVIPSMDPELEREQNRAIEERNRLLEDEAEARTRLAETQEEAIAAAEFELSLIGKSVGEQARLRAEFDLLNQAKRDGIDVDKERTESGRTYREEIEATAAAMGRLAEQEDKQRKSAERAAKATEFYNQQQEAFQQGVLDAILEGENLVDVLGGIAEAFARAALEAALFGSGPFGGGGGLLGGLFGKLFGWLTGILGSAKGNAFNVTGQGNAVRVSAYARGGLPSLGDYEDRVVRKPTLFDMGPDTVGLMGEAGDEAIVPLKGGMVRATIGGREVLIPLERAGDGHLGVRIPASMLQQPEDRASVTAYAYGGVPGGEFSGADNDGPSRILSQQEDDRAPGALAIDYRPTYHVHIADGQAKVSGGNDKAGQGTDQQRLLESMDAVIRAKMIEFLTNEMRNGGMLNPAVKPYG